MRLFTSHKKLKRIALGYVASHLVKTKESEAVKLQKLFKTLDNNNDGFLPVDQVVQVIVDNSGSVDETYKRQLEDSVREIDTDRSGSLDIEEFIAAAMQQATYLKESHINAAFQKFDTDGSGSISREELIAALGSTADVDDIMRHADLNKDGVIDYPEFEAVMREKSFEVRKSLSRARSRHVSK